MRITVICLIVIIFTPLPSAADYTVFHSNTWCKSYASIEPDSCSGRAYGDFVLGVITGINYMKERITTHDASALRMWVWNYCRENPNDNLNTAISQLNVELDKIAAK